jgi:lipopolysaccharide/colanic/teichoic acid biosynthesis glycosyltransferase
MLSETSNHPSQAQCAGNRRDEIARRGMDIALSALVLLLCAPLLLTLAILVKLTSPGPALFRQQRVGRNGHPFRLLKFRSMRIGGGGPSVTADGDNRITPIGRILRRTKLDELPQFLNVLRGEMSLVGPRPEVAEYVAHYTEEQREVLSVRPGITGPTQLAYRREEEMLKGKEDVVAFYLQEILPAKLAMDLAYVRRRTVWGDIGLLFQTALQMIRRD